MASRKVPLLLLLLVINAAPAGAAAPLRACVNVETAETLVPDPAFGRALVESVRLDLRTSETLSARLIACLDGDAAWFTDRDQSWDERTREQCAARVTALEKIIATNLPKLRQNLALADISYEGDGHDVSYADPVPAADVERWLVAAPYTFDHFLTRAIAHPYRDLADLEPLSNDEIRAAMARLDEVAAEYHAAGGAAPRDFFVRRRATYQAAYGKLLAANPVLGFLGPRQPTRADLRRALAVLLAHARRALARHEATFYANGKLVAAALDGAALTDLALYRSSLERVATAQPLSCGRAADLIARATRRGHWQTLGLAGLSLAAVIGCEVIKARVPGVRAWRFCAPGVGLATNTLGVIAGDLGYASTLEGVLQSPYGWTALEELDQLDERRFDYVLAWALAPVGSGLPLGKLLSPGLLRRLLP